MYAKGSALFKRTESLISKAQEISHPDFIELRVGSSLFNNANFLFELWKNYAAAHSEYKFSVVPYMDGHNYLNLSRELGQEFDILIGCFEAEEIHDKANFFVLGEHQICMAVPHTNPLAQKNKLTLQDLHGEHVAMVAPVDEFRKLLANEHPQVFIENVTTYYDFNTFNECARKNFLLLSLEVWKNIHPALKTIPLDTEIKIPFGLLTAKKPSRAVKKFLHIFSKKISA